MVQVRQRTVSQSRLELDPTWNSCLLRSESIKPPLSHQLLRKYQHICGIQKKKEGSKDRALRHSIVDSRSFRLFTVDKTSIRVILNLRHVFCGQYYVFTSRGLDLICDYNSTLNFPILVQANEQASVFCPELVPHCLKLKEVWNAVQMVH